MHHTMIKFLDKNEKNISWQKKHLENKTGSKNAYKPIKIKKMIKLKNMKLGNKFIFILL